MVPFDFLPMELSPAQQFITNLGLFIGVVIGVAINFLRHKAKPQAPPALHKDDVVIQSASIADMRPVREASQHLADLVLLHRQNIVHMDHLCQTWEGLREEIRSIRELIAEMAKENEISNRMRERGPTPRER
jgi:hypothetical protein